LEIGFHKCKVSLVVKAVKRPSIKNVRSPGGGGSSDADVRTFWYKNLRIFRNLWCVRTDKGGGRLSKCGHFANKGEGVNFSRFCADVIYGRPLSVNAAFV